MPELPEVETISRFLHSKIRGKRIIRLSSDTPRIFRGNAGGAGDVERVALGRTVVGVERKGKHVAFRLSDGGTFGVHLMMTGRLLLGPEPRPHDRAHFLFDDGTRMAFNDPRKFGRIFVGGAGAASAAIDPLRATRTEFLSALGKKRGAIKTVLMDQRVIGGIGNIYADEILWHAGVRPARRAAALTSAEAARMYQAMRKVLSLAIRKGGSTLRDYRKPDGSYGSYYDIRKCYGRAGLACSRDGGIIKRIVIGQRSAHYCPKHQK